MKRHATAHWSGTGKEGKGFLDSQSEVLSHTAYSYKTRFENEKGTNPEELVAAAHAGCFTMKLAFNLSGAGFVPENLETHCDIVLEEGSITHSHLLVKGKVPGITQQAWEELVKDAETNCPISRLLKTRIDVEARLIP